MPDLPDEIRDRAARAAYEHNAISPFPGWDDLREEWREIQRGEADAVVAVVMPVLLDQIAGLREERDGIVRARASEHKEMHRAGENIRRLVTQSLQLKDRVADLSTMLRAMARRSSKYRRLVETPAVVRELQLRQTNSERDQLKARIAELEEHERERLAQTQVHYSDAWHAYDRILKRMGRSVNVPLPGDLRYYEYEQQVVEKAVASVDRVEQLERLLAEVANNEDLSNELYLRVIAALGITLPKRVKK
jgi:hypothetical protein